MKIAIPMVDDKACKVFGRCKKFALIEIDKENKKIINQEIETPYSSKPGTFPKWLSQKNVDILIGGSIGFYTQCLFDSMNIEVITGAPEELPEKIILNYINNDL